MNPRIASMENLIASDPGGRNIFGLVLSDQLRLAAQSLRLARRVGIVSGFFIPAAGAGETDGPPGAAALGMALQRLGIAVDYLTDEANAPLFCGLGISLTDFSDYLSRASPTHLVSIERCGRARDGRYRNMHGEDVTNATASLDELFLSASDRGITTIGIGDGGNEIGMGKVFAAALETIPHGREIASVVPTDFCIAAGVSNWGAYGLVGALSVLAGQDLLPTPAEVVATVERLVREGGAVDGRTLLRAPTVDGLPLSATVRILEDIRSLVTPSPLGRGTPLRVGIIGHGETGQAAARLLASRGHHVRVSDQGNVEKSKRQKVETEQSRDREGAVPARDPGIEESTWETHGIEAFETGRHTVEFFAGCDLVVASPGVRADAPIRNELHARGTPVMSELEMAYQLCYRPIIAVTGTVGKRTTVEIMQRLFRAAGLPLDIGGNKGLPLSAILASQEATKPQSHEATEGNVEKSKSRKVETEPRPLGSGEREGSRKQGSVEIPALRDPNVEIEQNRDRQRGQPVSTFRLFDFSTFPVALAVSSFQLETVVHFRPDIAVILNIDEAHLDRHRSIAEYIRIKSRVFMNQRPEDVLILPYDDDRLRALARKHHGRTFFISAAQEVEHGAWLDGDCIRFWDGQSEAIDRGDLGSRWRIHNVLAATLVLHLVQNPST